MAITGLNTFIYNQVAETKKVNENFHAVQAEINGNLKNANFKAVPGAGETLTAESKLKFAETGGHTHNDTDSDKLALAVAGDGGTTDGAQGALKFKCGTDSVTALGTKLITFAAAFTARPYVFLYVDWGGGWSNISEGFGWHLNYIATDHFQMNSNSTAFDFYWIAIGI
jgi:hypothetical protein